MDEDTLGELNNSGLSKRPFSARIRIDGRRFRARVNFAGKSTLDAFKKSYDLELLDGVYEDRRKLL